MNITFFSPFSATMEWKSQELAIQKFINKNKRYKLNVLGCNGILKKNCPAIDSFNHLEKNKNNKVCNRCNSNTDYFNKKLSLNFKSIEDLLNEKAKKKIIKLMKSVNVNNIINFKINSFEIGKFASYEIINKYKKNDLRFSNVEFKDFAKNLENCLRVYFALENYSINNKTDVAIAYNGSYGICNLFLEYFKKKGSHSYLIHSTANNAERFEKIHFYKDNNITTLNKIKKNWKKFEKVPLKKSDVTLIDKHIETLLYANKSHTYSPSIKKNFVNIRKFFKIDKKKKIVLAALSSYDEILSSELLKLDQSKKDLFVNQISWISALVSFFRKKPNLHLIIRPHPREFIGKKTSNQIIQLKRICKNLPENITLNLPNQKISVFNYVGNIDLLLTSWSSIGEDLGYFGTPSMLTSPFNACYPENLSYVARSKSNYFNMITKITNSNKKNFLNTSIKFYRYKFFVFNKTTIDLSHILPKKNKLLSIFFRAIDKISLNLIASSSYKYYIMQHINKNFEIKGLHKIFKTGATNLSEILNKNFFYSNNTLDEEKKLVLNSVNRYLKLLK